MTTWNWKSSAANSDWTDPQNWVQGTLPTGTADIEDSNFAPRITTAIPNLERISLWGPLGLTITDNGHLITSGDADGRAMWVKTPVLIDGMNAWWDARGGAKAVLGITDQDNAILSLTNAGKFSADELWIGYAIMAGGTVNIGTGGMPGILDVGLITAGTGISPSILNFNHDDPNYYFTRDGSSSGVGVGLGSYLYQINHMGTGTTTLMGANNITHAYINESYVPICTATVSAGTLRAGSANAFLVRPSSTKSMAALSISMVMT